MYACMHAWMDGCRCVDMYVGGYVPFSKIVYVHHHFFHDFINLN
jgi:hypothetical protein